MKVEKKYYKLLDIIRVVSCLGVLLYHLGYLKGGFLSVCAFFVLSGYLSFISLAKKEKVSLKDYYKNRFIHIYLPLLAVVFLTTCVVTFMKDIHWFQLKPETNSVIFGFNNYWQLSVNNDYFARHISSPFMHFWYIGILLQFELVFPFIFMFIKFIKEKIHKFIPIIILSLLIICSCYYFVNCSINDNIMVSYYDTFARSFSLLLGILLGYIHINYKSITFKNNYLFFYIYLTIFVILQFIVDSNSSYYYISMILVSLITIRLIDYGVMEESNNLNFWEKEAKYLANVSYEVYLFQYPVIFFFQYIVISEAWKMPIMIILIFILSYFLHFTLDLRNQKGKYYRIVCYILLSIFVSYGFINYVNAKDYTNEMNDLKRQLKLNQDLSMEKQVEYLDRLEKEDEEWEKVLNDLNAGEENLASYVRNLPIVGVGDSVMLGAIPNLYGTFPNGYFDAGVSRTDYEANRILLGLKNQGRLSDNVLIHLGTNGQCGLPCQREIMETCKNSHVFIVTVSNDYEVHVNNSFYELAKMYPNITIIDWYSVAYNHPEYFVADGVHLTGSGFDVYKQTIYNGIYNYYHEQYLNKKNNLISEHEKELDSKIQFYGNETLLGIYDNLVDYYKDSGFNIEQDINIEKSIKEDIDKKIIKKKIFVSIDKKDNINKDDYLRIIDLTKDYEVYFLFIYHEPYKFNYDNVHVIDFSSSKNYNNYYRVDGIHLSDIGNRELFNTIKKGLEN